MGYTHYWDLNPDLDAAKWSAAIADCRKIIAASPVDLDLYGEADSPDHIQFNGSPDVSCEDFFMPATIEGVRSEIAAKVKMGFAPGTFDFTKTRNYPYDMVVTACLSVLAEAGLNVRSDGDAADWSDGVQLAADVLQRPVHNPIREGA